MNKRLDSALVVSLVVTVGLLGGGAWLLSRTAPHLLGQGGNSSIASSPSSSTTATAPRSQTQLTILGDTFSGYSTFRSAAFQDALAESGLDLRYEDEFDQAQRAARLDQGEADLIVTTLDQFLQQQPQGRIIGLIDRTVGADAVVLNTVKYGDLQSLNDVPTLVQQARSQGESLGIAFAGDTPSEYLALVLDTKFDALNLADFDITRVADASEAWQLMQDDQQNIAIAVLWEPFVAQAQQQGHTVVLSSEDAPNAIVDVIVASDRLIQSRPEQLRAFLAAYYRRIDANVRDASQLQQQIATDGDLSSSEAAAVIQGIDFFSASEAQTWLTDGTLQRRIEATAAVLTLSGRLNQVPPQPEQLYTADLIAEAARNTQTLIDLVRADNPELADRLSGQGQTVASAVPQLTQAEVQAAPDIGNLDVRGKVDFGTGSAQLTAAGQQTLKQLAQEVREFNPQTVAVRVIGHTSRSGSATFNQNLSQQRAQVVVDYLRSQGLEHNIAAEGKGWTEPLPGSNPADARNQRTEIRLVRVN